MSDALSDEWEALEQAETKFSQWMSKLDRRLRDMEGAAAESHIGSEFVGKLMGRLKKLEQEMATQFDYCKNFAENGHKMVDKLGADTEYGVIILKKLDKMKEVWDETVQRLDTLGHIVTKLNELSLEDESVHEEGEQSDTRSESSSKSQKQQQSSPPVSVHKQPVSPVIPIDKSPKKSHHPQSRIPPPTRYKETRPGDSASSSSSAKKPKLDRLEELGGQIQEWQKSLDSFANWLKTVEELLSIGEDETSDNQSLPWFQMSLENQQYILNDTISDLKTRKDEYDKLVEQGKKFEDDLALYNANTSDISEIVDAIKERWTEIENVLEKRKTYHLHLIEVSKIAKETEKISNVLKNVEEFLKNSPEKKTGDVLLRMQENCVERMRILKNYEIKIDDWISQLTKILEQEPSIEDDPIFIATVNSFKLWEEMVDKLESMRKRIDVLTNKGKNVTSESNADIRELTDGIMALVDWLEEIKSVEFGESLIIPTNQDDLDKQLNQLKELEKSFRSEEITYNQVRESTLEVIRSNLKTSRIRELESKLENLNKLWAECNQELDHRLTKLDEISMRITNLEYDIDQLEAWLEELDDFLLENLAYGDIQTLENQIEQCDVVLEQIKSSAELEDINNKLQEILDAVGELESDLPSLLEKKMEELNDRWLSIKNRANKKKLGLEAALTKAKSAFDELEKLENDLKSVSFETDEFSNSLVDDYKQIRITGEKLKEKLIILSSQASELEKMASNLCPEPEMITQSLEQARARVDLIVKTIEKLDKQISVTQLALKNSNLDYGEFKRLVRMEKEWLGGLERKLKRSPQSAADAEEISGNLDDLETYIRHRSESRCEKINELGKKLTQLSFMTESIAADMSHITKQWEMLHHQTQERLDDLEASVSDAQKCEQQVLRVQRWIESVDTQLQQWQEDDIAADDVPHEVERLEETFEENRNILEKLKGSIENYRSRERLEAATRLGEQLNVLNTQYLELVEKLKKFKHPSGFETRINIISKNLHQMLSNLQNLKVTSHESHVIQDELLECHSMIKEIKNFRKEMDRVSSQGKLALETSEDPSLLKIKLDKIRDLFDTVSKQAIQRRKELEHLLSMSEEISSEMLSIESWLNQQENPLSIDKTVFVVWQQKLEELTDKVQSFNRISSGQSMPLLNKTLSTIQSDFELLRRKMVLRSNNSEEREPSLEPTKESSEISSKERMAEMLFGSLDSAQSSLKSTSSRKSSLTPKTVDSISSLSKVFRPLDFFTIDELKMIHDDIKRAQNILDTDETLNSGDYKSHAEQREKLRCIQDLIEPNKPKITKIVSEKYMISKLHPESEDMIPVISILLSDWKAIRKRFLRRHRRWWFAKETMKEFEVSRKQINNFLEMVKDPITETRLPTEELNIEVARRNYPRLLSYFSDYISTYGTFQAMTRKLSNNLSEKAEEIYKQIITTTDQRWNEVVQELAWQKQRLYNEERNLDLQLYWNELEQWMDKVNSTISKLHKGIDSFEDANILENEIKNFEKEIPEQWLNQKTISSAPTTVIGKDVESIEKDFNKLLIELPEARIDLERYLTSFKVVSKMLEEELQWASITSKGQDTEPKKKNEHEANYEKLEIMLEEIETDARRFGHKAPSFLARKMKSLREAWKNIPNMTDFSAEPSHKDWYRWLDHQLDYITHSYSDCHDKEILGKLKTFLDKFQQLIDSFQSSQDLVGDPSQSDSNLPTTHQKPSDVNSESSGNLETMDRDYSWDALRDKTSNVRMRLEANSGDQMNQLILCLRELIEYVIKRQTELDSMPTIGGDMNTLSQQQQDYSNLRAQLDEKKPVIENTLTSARSCLPKGLPPSEEGIYGIGLDEPSKLARTVQREVNKLSEKWYHLLHNFDQQQRKMDEVMKKMIGLQKQMDDLFVNLHRAEAIKSQWQPISDLILDHLPEQMHELQQFRENIFSIKAQVDQVNETATRITGSNVLLSHTNLNRLEELNTRWKLIQVAIEDRRKGLEQAMIDHGSAQQQFLSSSVEHPWERAVAPNKVPYYINHATETTHWDHPKMTLLMNSLTEFNEIRYSAYRTSMKLRSVQRSLCLDYVHILSLIGIFEEYGLRGENDKLISVPKMINCLQTVYEKACNGGDNAPAVVVPLCIDLCLNWLLNLYDSTSRTGHIRILSFKIGLVTLCKGALEEKYRFMFRLIADSEGFSDERKLAVLLHDLVQVPRLLGEVAAFGGTNIEPSVRSCVERAGNKAEIESIDFLSWLQQEPQSIVWLPVLHRLLTAETAKHQSKCNVCKAYPIVGFRYRCMLCFNFDMCQTCFFFGKTAKNHKNSHPMQEYCLATSSGEDLHDFTRIIRNKFKSKRYFKKRSKCGYLPVQTVLEGDSLESPTVSPSHQSYNGMNSEMDAYTERFAEVELNGHRNPTVNADGTEEEHRLIAQYCQSLNPNHGPSQILPNPAQIIANIDAEQRDELESMIHQLEEENRALLGEYERLKAEKGNRVILNGSDSYSSLGRRELENEYHSALLLESKALKTSWKELENKRMFLENQNKQLETTLDRLRQFLKPISEASLSPTTAARLRSALGQSRIPPSTPSISSNPGYRMNGSSSDGYYPTDMR